MNADTTSASICVHLRSKKAFVSCTRFSSRRTQRPARSGVREVTGKQTARLNAPSLGRLVRRSPAPRHDATSCAPSRPRPNDRAGKKMEGKIIMARANQHAADRHPPTGTLSDHIHRFALNHLAHRPATWDRQAHAVSPDVLTNFRRTFQISDPAPLAPDMQLKRPRRVRMVRRREPHRVDFLPRKPLSHS